MKLEKVILEIMELDNSRKIELVELDECVSEIHALVDSITSSALETTL